MCFIEVAGKTARVSTWPPICWGRTLWRPKATTPRLIVERSRSPALINNYVQPGHGRGGPPGLHDCLLPDQAEEEEVVLELLPLVPLSHGCERLESQGRDPHHASLQVKPLTTQKTDDTIEDNIKVISAIINDPVSGDTSARILFMLRCPVVPHQRGLIWLQISDRKSVNHTTEMIL